MVLCPATPEGSTGSCSGFKASQNSLKSHPTDWEKPGIENYSLCFCGRVPVLYQYWPGGFMLFVVLCQGTPEGSTGRGSGFKASQKTGQRLKVSSERLGEAGN